MIPMGRFGCKYCLHFRSGRCIFRNLEITNPNSTTCGSVFYNLIARKELGLNRNISEIESEFALAAEATVFGSIMAITDVEGECLYVPWTENSEITTVPKAEPCQLCKQTFGSSRFIHWKGKDYFFCSFLHYLDWRNNLIDLGQITDEEISQGTLYPFRNYYQSKSLEIYAPISESKELLNAPDNWRPNKFISVAVLVVAVKLSIILYNTLFN